MTTKVKPLYARGTHYCVKCGVTCHSKNPSVRNTFLSDDSLAMCEAVVYGTLDNLDRKEPATVEKLFNMVLHTWVSWSRSSDQKGEGFDDLSPIEQMNEFTKRLACEHRWELQEGQENSV